MKTVTACHTSRTSAGFVWSCTARVRADPPGRTYLGPRSSSVLTTWRLLHCVSGEWWHVDENSDPHAIRLGQLLDSFGLVQHVCELTHQAGHILELDRHQSYLHGDYCTACQGNDDMLMKTVTCMPYVSDNCWIRLVLDSTCASWPTRPDISWTSIVISPNYMKITALRVRGMIILITHLLCFCCGCRKRCQQGVASTVIRRIRIRPCRVSALWWQCWFLPTDQSTTWPTSIAVW